MLISYRAGKRERERDVEPPFSVDESDTLTTAQCIFSASVGNIEDFQNQREAVNLRDGQHGVSQQPDFAFRPKRSHVNIHIEKVLPASL